MKLITKELEKTIPKLYEQEDNDDPIVYVKLFTPWTNWTWYVTEYEPAERLYFGFVSGLEDEWGYFSLDELESIRGPFGLQIERDIFFIPTPISQVKGGRS